MGMADQTKDLELIQRTTVINITYALNLSLAVEEDR